MQEIRAGVVNMFASLITEQARAVASIVGNDAKLVYGRMGPVRGFWVSSNVNADVTEVYLVENDHNVWACPYAYPLGDDYMPPFARTAVFSDPFRFQVLDQGDHGIWVPTPWVADMGKAGIPAKYIEKIRPEVEAFASKWTKGDR